MQKTITKTFKFFKKSNLRFKIFITVLTLTLMSHSLMVGQITYTFTNAGATGRFGPSQAQLNTAYASTNLNGAVTSNSGIQAWTVPLTGNYTITAAGASGGSSSYGPGGSGIKVQSVVSLIAGQVLNIVIGQQGQNNGSTSQFNNGGSGGGGSFIYTGAIGSTGLILSAGGGGGALSSNMNVISSNISDASFSVAGNSISDAGGFIAVGGTNGSGGGFSNRTILSGGPGTGWVSQYDPTYGSNFPTLGGTRFTGGIPTSGGLDGGFGGGGASGDNSTNPYVWAGGGGGYSGGGGGHNGGMSDGQVGGGGGSFLTGTNQLNLGTNSGDGYVIISVVNGQALNFDGTNDYVSVPHNSSLNFGTGDFSVEAYFKSSASQPNYAGVVVKQNSGGNGGWQLVVVGNKIAAEISSSGLMFGVGNGLQGTTTITDGNWHHLAMVVTRSQNKIELFVDGNVEASLVNSNVSTMNVNFTTPMLIGVERTYIAYSNASIDEVRLWNVARTKCDINTYKNCEIPTTSPGLTGNYHFNQGIAAGANPSETSLTDLSGNSNNGTLTNFALTGATSNWITPGGVIAGSITPLPLPVITASPSNTTICNSQSALLTGGGAATYTWSGGITNAVAFAPATTASYTVTGTASTGCTNSAVATVSVNNCTPAAALDFDGADDDVRATGFANFTEYTIEGWFKLNSLVDQNLVVGTGNGNPNTWFTNQLKLNSGKFTHYLYDGSVQTVSSPIIPTTGVWYHVAIVAKNGTPARIYVNGTQSVSASTVGSMSGANEYRLGGTAGGAPNAFNGEADEVRIWNVARTQCEINTYKNCEIATTATGLLVNYHFNQGFAAVPNTVVTATNAASASYNGTLYNFALTGATSNWIAPGGVISGSVTPASLIPVVTANVTSSVICNGASTTLNGGGANTYTWTGGVTNGVSFSPVNTATYTVIGTNTVTGCTSTNTAAQGVTVNPLPVVTANATSPVICNGGSTNLNGGGANTYTWTGGVTNGVSFSPVNTATYTVIGTNTLTGCTSTNAAAQGVTVNPLPVVTANATSPVICNGASTTLNGGGANTYTWTGGVTNGVSFSPVNTATYTVIGTNTLTGCTSTNTAAQGVTVNPLPVISVNSGSICNGQSFTMIPSGASTYTFSNGSSIATPTITSSYSITGTSTAGCVSSAPAVSNVTVNNLPVISVNSGVICNGQSFTMTPTGAITYTFSNGSAVVSPTGNTSYSVTGTDAIGCVSSIAAVSDVTVNALPVVTASISNAVICEGSTTTLNGGGADTYTWTGGVTDGVAFTPIISGSYTVTGTSTLTGCSSTNTAVESVTVNTLPVVTAAITNSVICEGFSTTLNGGGADTYTWTGGVTDAVAFTPTVTGSYTVTGTNTLTGCSSTNVAVESVTVNPNPVISAASGAICTNGSYTITPNGASTYTITGGSAIVSPSVTTSYSVTGTSVDGCTGNTAVVTVSVQTSLTVSIAGSNSVCDGNAVSLTANGAATYSWNTGSTSNTIAPTPTVNTTYSVVGSSGTCSDSAIVNITVNANPTVTAVSNASLICAGQSVSLTASGATTYTWNSSTTGSTITDTPTTTTTYTVIGEDVNGCMNTVMFTQNVSPCTGIYAANAVSTSIRVYPNPTTGMINVEVESNATVIVLNTLGQVISTGNMIAGKNQIDIKEFANGIYFVKVTQNGTQQTIRLIKE